MWEVPTASRKYGLQSGGPATPIDSPLPAVAGPSRDTAASLARFSLANPLTVFGILVAATVGLMAANTSLRVGPVRVSGSVGDDKK